MAKNQDLVVKMTINSTDFDTGLQNAKKSMKGMQDQTVTLGSVFKKTMGAMAKAAGTLGLVMGGTEMFKSFIKSTQTLGDKWTNTMTTAKTSFQALEMAVATGNQNILQNFRQSISAAREFAEAMDRVGSAQISNQYARMKYVTPFNEAMTKYRDAKGSGDTTGMAYAANDMQRYLNAYGDNAYNLMSNTRTAVAARLSSLSGGNITSANLDQYLDRLYLELINGVLPESVRELKDLRGQKDFSKRAQMAAEYAQKYGTDVTKESEVLLQLSEINDETLKELLGILQTYDSVRNDLTSMRRQMNRAMGATATATATGGNTTVAAGAPAMSEAQVMQYLTRKIQNEILGDDRAKDSVPIEIELLDEEIVEADTEALCQAVIKTREEMALLAQNTQMAMTAANYLGQAFVSMGNIADGTLGDVFNALGSIIGQITSTITAMMTLAGAETVEGIADVFANQEGDAFTKLAVTAAAWAGILGMISTAKSAFAGSYADGGIVGGTSYSGDKLWARVNSGEMILNRNQQAALLNSGGQVNFIIEGSQLKGVLENYDKMQNL